MEKALKNSIYIILLSLLVFNCKTDKNNSITNKAKQLLSKNTDTIKTIKSDIFRKENPNCLKESDTLAIKRFKKQLIKAIVQKDSLAIANFIQYTYMDKNITLEDKRKSLDRYDYQPIMNLCFKSIMSEYDLGHLDGESYFNEKKGSKGCFTYEISNNFPKLEFAHVFIFEKIDGYIKLVEIQTIG